MKVLPRMFAPAALALFGAVVPAVGAQTFPARPVNLVVTVPAGGSIDATARILAADLSPALGQPVVVVNRPGAGGNLAGEAVARAAPDGHTLMICSSATLTINPHVYKTMPFDPIRSFEPIIMPARLNLILAVHPRHAVNSVQEFVSVLRAQPDKLGYSSSGNGSNPQLAGVLFGLQTGTSALHVPFSGIAPALNALLSGQVDFMFDSATSIPHVQAGKLRALAVIGPTRLPLLPSVPTLTEMGYADMPIANGFYAVVATAGTPREVVRRLNAEMVRILKQPAVMERIANMGLVNTTSTPEELGAAIRDDLQRLGPIIKAAKITLQ
ncbi:MAG: Bug family tripartite tricarboxylate transporter substrate binding protein [Pseudomonadota bacterium]